MSRRACRRSPSCAAHCATVAAGLGHQASLPDLEVASALSEPLRWPTKAARRSAGRFSPSCRSQLLDPLRLAQPVMPGCAQKHPSGHALGGMLDYGEASSGRRGGGNPARAQGKTRGLSWGFTRLVSQQAGGARPAWAGMRTFWAHTAGSAMRRRRCNTDGQLRFARASGSAETGYAMRLRADSDWVIEPQGQLIISTAWSRRHREQWDADQ